MTTATVREALTRRSLTATGAGSRPRTAGRYPYRGRDERARARGGRAAAREPRPVALRRHAPAAGSTLGRGEFALVLLALLALGAVLQVFRVGPAAALNAFWAEDGQVFFQGALLQGFFDAVFTPYAGYLVVVPRLIGEVGDLVPLADAPAAVSLTAALVVALSGLAVWYASAGHDPQPLPARHPRRWSWCWRRWRAWRRSPPPPTSPGTCSSPASGCCSGARASTRGAALAGLFILATALSNPGVWYFAPVFALRLLAARDRRDALILGGYALGAAIQLPVTLASSENTVEPVWTSDIWTAYVQRVVDGAALGESLGGEAWSQLGLAVPDRPARRPRRGLSPGSSAAPRPPATSPRSRSRPRSGCSSISTYQRAVGFVMTWPAGRRLRPRRPLRDRPGAAAGQRRPGPDRPVGAAAARAAAPALAGARGGGRLAGGSRHLVRHRRPRRPRRARRGTTRSRPRRRPAPPSRRRRSESRRRGRLRPGRLRRLRALRPAEVLQRRRRTVAFRRPPSGECPARAARP